MTTTNMNFNPFGKLSCPFYLRFDFRICQSLMGPLCSDVAMNGWPHNDDQYDNALPLLSY
jgi:hypothetical protein